MESNTELAYLAGLFDGEGCVSILKVSKQAGFKSFRYRLRIQITNTNKHLMNWLNERFNFHIATHVPLKKNWKMCWVALKHDRKARNMLVEMLPYLKVKKDEALLAIEFQKHKDQIGTSNGASGLTQEQIEYRERLKKELSALKEQKI